MSFKVFKREGFDEIVCFDSLVFVVDEHERLLSVSSIHGAIPPDNLVIPSVLPSGHKISAIASGFKVYPRCVSIKISDDISVIEERAFSPLSGVYKVIWPKSCTSIPERCFEYGNIVEIEGIEDVKTIGKSAFHGCYIERFTVPSGVTIIPSGIFKSCGSLVEIVLHDNITRIDASAFWGSKITEIRWPSRCSIIPKTCFRCCHRLTKIENIENVTAIGKQAFSSTGLKSFNWPKQCKEIPGECFSACELVSIEGIEDVETVGSYAFKKCKKLKKIKWPSKACSIPSGCFYETRSLREIEIPDTVSEIGERSFVRSGFTTFKWPPLCNDIPNFCFYMSNLETIAGIENVNAIGEYAFGYSSIRSLDLSKTNVLSIGPNAFCEIDEDQIILPYYLNNY